MGSVVAAGSLLALAAVLAGRHWLQLLDERNRERDYALRIATGLPLATGAATLGAALALLLAVVLFPRHPRPRPPWTDEIG